LASTNETDHHDITEILLIVALSTINQTIIVLNMYVFFGLDDLDLHSR
jgi:hypothetical protein